MSIPHRLKVGYKFRKLVLRLDVKVGCLNSVELGLFQLFPVILLKVFIVLNLQCFAFAQLIELFNFTFVVPWFGFSAMLLLSS